MKITVLEREELLDLFDDQKVFRKGHVYFISYTSNGERGDTRIFEHYVKPHKDMGISEMSGELQDYMESCYPYWFGTWVIGWHEMDYNQDKKESNRTVLAKAKSYNVYKDGMTIREIRDAVKEFEQS